jgi:hypothetical protein
VNGHPPYVTVRQPARYRQAMIDNSQIWLLKLDKKRERLAAILLGVILLTLGCLLGVAGYAIILHLGGG